MTETQFNAKNYDKGACTVVSGSAKVVLKTATTTACNFACKSGYYHAKGDTKIAFTCAHNGGVTKAAGSDNWDTLEMCKGA